MGMLVGAGIFKFAVIGPGSLAESGSGPCEGPRHVLWTIQGRRTSSNRTPP